MAKSAAYAETKKFQNIDYFHQLEDIEISFVETIDSEWNSF